MVEESQNEHQSAAKRVKERRHYTDDWLQDEEIEGRRMFSVQDKLNSPNFGPYFVKELRSEDFSLKYIQENGFDTPLVFHERANLGMRIPNENFTINDVRQYVGNKRILDVMDVATQKDVEMSMKDWCRYFENPVREKLYNVISLEFSHTRMESHVEAPTVVRQMDWVDLVWPRHLKESQTESTNSIEDMKYPKVQKYCLMSVKGCYTDFHIDFGGSSVWYHIFKGQKVFWLIPPNERNLLLYEKWVLSGKQSDIFFGDTVEQCARITLNAGDTFFIPSGWIHAVYTPQDSMVFGGNFLHTFGAEMQIRVHELEDSTRVKAKFRYPFFTEIMWYTLQRHVYCLLGKNYLTCNEEGLESAQDPPPLQLPDMSQLSLGNKPPLLPPSTTSALDCSAPKVGAPPPVLPGASKPPWKLPRRVHLTKYELAGLRAILQWLIQLPPGKKNVPELLTSPEGLLNDVKLLLQDQARYDPQQAITGKPVLSWSTPSKSKVPSTTNAKTPKGQKGGSSANSSARRRRTRCKKCQACLRADCGDCHFCKDMKKFGGPGKMKQSCISRQCMAPVLPHTACCMICGRDGWEKVSNPHPQHEHENSSLMECSQCWEIVHPACLRDRYPDLPPEGASNEELPNSWECPKCCRDGGSTGKSDQVKPRNLKVNKPTPQQPPAHKETEEPLALDHHRSYVPPPPTIMAPTYFPPNPASLPQHQASLLLDLPKPPERSSSILTSPSPSSAAADQPLALTANDRTPPTMTSTFNPQVNTPLNFSTSNGALPSQNKYSNYMQSSPSKMKKFKPFADSRPKSNYFGPFPSKKHSETSRDRIVRSLKGLKKNTEINRHHNIYRINKTPRPSDSSSPLSLTTGTPPTRDQNQNIPTTPSTPKSSPPTPKSEEAASPSKFIKLESPPSPEENVAKPATILDIAIKEEEKEEKKGDQPPEEMVNKVIESANLRKPKYVVRPAPILDEIADDETNYMLKKDIAFLIFRYLSPKDLNTCQYVCKAWNRWTMDPQFWTNMNLSRHRMTASTLMGIIRRQPLCLNLAWTNISRRQLAWLIARLPQLKELSLSGCSAAAASALCTFNCPLLRSLDLSWMEGLTDLLIKDLLMAPNDARPGFVGDPAAKTRLRQLTEIRLAGADVSDVSLRVLTHNLPLLARLDLSHCNKVTDMGIAVLGATKGSRLATLDLAFCPNVTDTSLEVLRRCPNLVHLDMRHCPQVTDSSCVKFAQQTRMLITEGKLFIKPK